MIESIQEEKDVVSLLLSLNSKDDYTYQHSVQVGMLSYYIAKWMNKVRKKLLILEKQAIYTILAKAKSIRTF